MTQFARVLSYTINPLILPPALFGVIAYWSGGTGVQVAVAMGLAVLFFCAIPLVSMIQAVRGVPDATIELRDRTQRTVPYLVAIGSYVVALAVIARSSLPARDFLLAVTATFILNGVLMLVINLYWKISLHVSTLAGFFSIVWFFLRRVESGVRMGAAAPSITLAAIAIVLTATMMWARVETEAHTRAQVLGGAAFGFVAPYVVLLFLA